MATSRKDRSPRNAKEGRAVQVQYYAQLREDAGLSEDTGTSEFEYSR